MKTHLFQSMLNVASVFLHLNGAISSNGFACFYMLLLNLKVLKTISDQSLRYVSDLFKIPKIPKIPKRLLCDNSQ